MYISTSWFLTHCYRHAVLLLMVISCIACSSAPPPRPVDFDKTWQPQTVLSEVYLLPTAPEALARRIEAVRQAKHYIQLEYFTWDHDLVGAYLYRELLNAADRGVKVRLVLDDLMEFEDRWLVELAEHSNIHIRIFNPFDSRKLGWFSRAFNFQVAKQRLNHRLHEKFFNVDGEVMILGGRNIGDSYFGYSKKANFFDLDVMVKGESIREFERNFQRLWSSEHVRDVWRVIKATPKANQATFLADYLSIIKKRQPELQHIEQQIRQLTSPDYSTAEVMPLFDSLDKLTDSQPYLRSRMQSVLDACLASSSSILISTPYLVPSEDSFSSLKVLSDNGVALTLLTNSSASNDSPFVGAYYAKHREELAGLAQQLFEYAKQAEHPDYYHQVKTYYHNKAFIVDQRLSYIGSSNFDPRSNFLNMELGLLINSRTFALQLKAYLLKNQQQRFWRVSLNEQQALVWQKDQQLTNKNPGSSAFKRLSERLYRLLNIKYDI
ncbi:phospholipase D-like domain-containing protein [Agarivorans sp. MS3-6]